MRIDLLLRENNFGWYGPGEEMDNIKGINC